MYGEDALICHQIKMHGKLLYNVPEAKITHYEGASFCKIDDYKVKLIIDGNYQYYLKAFGKRAANTYLRNMIKKERKKLFVWRLLLKDKVKLSNIYLFLTAYKEKLNKESI